MASTAVWSLDWNWFTHEASLPVFKKEMSSWPKLELLPFLRGQQKLYRTDPATVITCWCCCLLAWYLFIHQLSDEEKKILTKRQKRKKEKKSTKFRMSFIFLPTHCWAEKTTADDGQLQLLLGKSWWVGRGILLFSGNLGIVPDDFDKPTEEKKICFN